MSVSTGTTRQPPRLTRTETAAAGLLLLATALAVLWVNGAPENYEHFWHTEAALLWGTVRSRWT